MKTSVTLSPSPNTFSNFTFVDSCFGGGNIAERPLTAPLPRVNFGFFFGGSTGATTLGRSNRIRTGPFLRLVGLGAGGGGKIAGVVDSSSESEP